VGKILQGVKTPENEAIFNRIKGVRFRVAGNINSQGRLIFGALSKWLLFFCSTVFDNPKH
jgi:hypothetical protein